MVSLDVALSAPAPVHSRASVITLWVLRFTGRSGAPGYGGLFVFEIWVSSPLGVFLRNVLRGGGSGSGGGFGGGGGGGVCDGGG